MELSNIKTYIYIDVSNIRSACLASCNFNLDFIKLFNYLKDKYPNAVEIRYYEGIAKDDNKKQKHFDFLEKRIGYKICSLERKSYIEPAKYEKFKCKKCGTLNNVQVLPPHSNLKSNVDVYLASDMIKCAAKHNEPIHIILISCDGDYAEAIRSIQEINKKAFITIMATPMTRKNNCLSSRLQVFSNRSSKNTALVNIASVKDYISQPISDKDTRN